MAKNVNVVVVRGGVPIVERMDPTNLVKVQGLVGGYVETFRLPAFDLVLLVNEEGRMQFSKSTRTPFDQIPEVWGDYVIGAISQSSEKLFYGLLPAKCRKIVSMYEKLHARRLS